MVGTLVSREHAPYNAGTWFVAVGRHCERSTGRAMRSRGTPRVHGRVECPAVEVKGLQKVSFAPHVDQWACGAVPIGGATQESSAFDGQHLDQLFVVRFHVA